MIKYQRLTLLDREEISRQIASGQSVQEIARNLNRAPSTISREIRRFTIQRDDYRAILAQRRAHRNLHKLARRYYRRCS